MNHRTSTNLPTIAASMLALLAGAAYANPATIVLANNAHAGASGKDAVPGMPGFQFTNFNKIYGSAGGTWIVAVTVTGPGVTTATDQVVVLGDGMRLETVAREGVTVVGSGGQLLNLSGLAVPRISSNGAWAICFTPAAGAPGLVVKKTYLGYQTVAVGSTFCPALNDVYGAIFASATILSDDSVAFLSDSVSGSPRGALRSDGANVFALEGTSTYADPIPTGHGGLLRAISFSQIATTMHVTEDGQHTAFLGDIDFGSTPLRSVIRDGVIVQQVGQDLPGVPGQSITAISEAWMEHDGTWFSRGTSASGAFVCRNGAVIARVGSPIYTGTTEAYTTITDYKGDTHGNYIVTGVTNAAGASNEVAVLNGATVVAREADPVDLNGDGVFSDGLFIHSFRDRCFFSGDGYFYVGARMKSSAATSSSLGANVSLIRIPVSVRCVADYNGDGGVDGADVESFFTEWASGVPNADVNNDGGVDGADVGDFFGAWSAGGC